MKIGDKVDRKRFCRLVDAVVIGIKSSKVLVSMKTYRDGKYIDCLDWYEKDKLIVI